jgi:uncharacterized protein YaaQ
MKLIIAIVSNDDSPALMKELVRNQYFVTKLSSSGGFLRRGNTTLMIGAKDNEVDGIIKLISEHSKTRNELIPSSVISEFGIMPSAPLEVTVGGATIFVVQVEDFMKI